MLANRRRVSKEGCPPPPKPIKYKAQYVPPPLTESEDPDWTYCCIPGDECAQTIPCQGCFDADEGPPLKNYLDNFCAMFGCATEFTTPKCNPIYARSYERKTYNHLEPCLLSKCVKKPERKKYPDNVKEYFDGVAAKERLAVQNAGISSTDERTKRRSCNDYCCRPLLASRLDLTCTHSQTKGCKVPKPITYSPNCASSCPSDRWMLSQQPKPLTVNARHCRLDRCYM